jgi:hypothetical protein
MLSFRLGLDKVTDHINREIVYAVARTFKFGCIYILVLDSRLL